MAFSASIFTKFPITQQIPVKISCIELLQILSKLWKIGQIFIDSLNSECVAFPVPALGTALCKESYIPLSDFQENRTKCFVVLITLRSYYKIFISILLLQRGSLQSI